MLIEQIKKVSGIAGRLFLFGLVVQMWLLSCPVFAVGEVPIIVEGAAVDGGGASAADTPLPDLFTGAMSYQICSLFHVCNILLEVSFGIYYILVLKVDSQFGVNKGECNDTY